MEKDKYKVSSTSEQKIWKLASGFFLLDGNIRLCSLLLTSIWTHLKYEPLYRHLDNLPGSNWYWNSVKFQLCRPHTSWEKCDKHFSCFKIGEKEKWRNKGMDEHEQPDSGIQYQNQAYQNQAAHTIPESGIPESGCSCSSIPLFLHFSFSPILKHEKCLSYFSQEVWGLQSWNLIHTWTMGGCIMFTGIRLLLLIHPFISSFFFLSISQTLKIFFTLLSKTFLKLKLGMQMNNGWTYDVYWNQAAAYLSFYFFIFLSLQF